MDNMGGKNMAEKATITMAERNKMIMELRAQFTEKFDID